ncbi:MAG: ABC transporter ATP-binding protein, partial [Leptotrichiaceae bacterium]|nr:ABC transporter ATP-binding protein [Leptotrichiaceae bacterium]
MKKFENRDIESIKKLRKYTKRYSLLIVLNMLLAMVSSTVSSLPIALIKRLFDKGIIAGSEKDILYAAGAMILFAVIGAVLVYWNAIFSTIISSSIYKNIVDDIYIKVQEMDMEYFSGTKVGELMVKVMNDPGNINTLIIETFYMISEIFRAIICLVIALYVDWKLTLGVLVVAPVLMIAVRRYSKKLKNSGKEKQEAIGTLNSKLQETLSGIRVIKAFATERTEIRNFKKKSLELKKVELKTSRYNAKSSSISEAVNYIMIAILLLFGGFRAIRGNHFTAGDFITIVGAIASMYTPIRRAITRYNSISVNIPSIGRVFEVMEKEPKVTNKENSVNFEEFKKEILFSNVEFSYLDSKEKILKGINLKVEKGETIALVGNSGGGKSTIVNLIPRFFDVTNGSLEIDGIDVRDYNVKSLRKKIGIVP